MLIALRAGAEYWHTGIVPAGMTSKPGGILADHFEAGVQSKYGYAPRSPSYLKQKGGRPSLVFNGSLRRDLKVSPAYIIGARNAIVLNMRARIFNLVPNLPQNSEDLYVKHKNGRGYPNLKREIRVVTDDEREMIAKVVQVKLVELFGSDPQTAAVAA